MHFSPGINHRDKNRGDRESGRRGRLSSDLIVFSLWDWLIIHSNPTESIIYLFFKMLGLVFQVGLYHRVFEAKWTTSKRTSHWQTVELFIFQSTVEFSELGFGFVCLWVHVCRADWRFWVKSIHLGDSSHVFPAECGSETVRELIRMDKKGFTHALPDWQESGLI